MEQNQGNATIESSTGAEHDVEFSTKRSAFHERLNDAAGEISYRKLGRLTDTHPETVRRYMQGQAPSATFLTNLCRVMGISGEWLLTGHGPMKCSDMRTHALSQADPSELLTAVANTMTDLCDRMDRLERFVQSIETRINAGGSSSAPVPDSGRPKAAKLVRASEPKPMSSSVSIENGSETSEPATPTGGIERNGTSAQRIRDAIAKRPS